jgi:hypothetical protein
MQDQLKRISTRTLDSLKTAIMPWTCQACGKQYIPGNKTVCPDCFAVRGTSDANPEAIAAAAAAGATADHRARQVTRTYKGDKALRHGIAHMQRHGWRVASQSSFQPRAGLGRVIMLGGIGALVWKPKPAFVVTFER